MKTKFLFFALLLMFFSIAASAQRRHCGTTVNHHERLRIAQGVRNGNLTRGEAIRLRAANARVNHFERQAASDGVVTPRERRKAKIMERRLNRQIFIQKHD